MSQWASSGVAQSSCSAGDTGRRTRASASPTRTSPTWTMTRPRLPAPPAGARNPEASPAASSNASPSAHPKARAKTVLQMEEPAHSTTESRTEKEERHGAGASQRNIWKSCVNQNKFVICGVLFLFFCFPKPFVRLFLSNVLDPRKR